MATSIGNDTPKSPVSTSDTSTAVGSRNLDDDKDTNGEGHRHGYSFNAQKAEESYPASPTGQSSICLPSGITYSFSSVPAMNCITIDLHIGVKAHFCTAESEKTQLIDRHCSWVFLYQS